LRFDSFPYFVKIDKWDRKLAFSMQPCSCSAVTAFAAPRSSRLPKPPALTRQALYHHFESKEALFRAVIERVHETAIAAEDAVVSEAEKAGGGLTDILVAGMTARMKAMIASFDGSPHIEELYSEHLVHACDLYQKYSALYAERLVATIARLRASRIQRCREDVAGRIRAAC
jgi:AcrR family transcriptional regulator